MLFVTVGTEQYQFDALMKWIELLRKYQLITEEVVIQYGSSTFFPNGARVYQVLPEQEFQKLIDCANLIVGHCGEGTAQLLEGLDKPYVLVPRSHRFREHVDDHQMEMADAFEQRGIAIARSPADLAKFVKLSQTAEVNTGQVEETQLCQYLQEHYQPQKMMLVCSSGGHFKYMQSLKPFWEQCSDRAWVTFRTGTTETEIEDDRRYWAHSPTNRNLPNLIRNLGLAFSVVRRQRPELILSTGAGVAVPFLLAAKWFCKSQVIFVESKTRLKNISLSARILKKLGALDLLVVRSEAIADIYPQSVYIPITDENAVNQEKDFKQASIALFGDVALISTPEELQFVTARDFLKDFQTLCNADDSLAKVIVDMSRTRFMDSAGLGVLINCLKLATTYGTELVLWSVNDAVISLLAATSLSNVFAIEPASQTFRTSESNQKIQGKKVNPIDAFLYKLQKVLNKVPVVRLLVIPLKFLYPAIDIDPSIDLHPSVRNPVKRLIDIVGGLVGLFFTALFFIPIAIAIGSESKGGILFGQNRCGLLSKPFRIWKFRSMVKNAEELKNKVQNQVDADKPSQDTTNNKFFKNENDPRVTKTGKFLRKTSLDEFPQFWNVLVGDMSLVGTRPPTFNEISAYELEMEYQDEKFTEWNRLDVKPGMTGMWQVNGRSSVRSFAEVVNFDIEYRKNWSVWYDLQLILKTIVVLFDRKNKAV
ncbi:sugar transferase [Tumidithrix elongata RA019]|uniref:Sugar transferase n=1 Tax=Tumidithrix elongata BACA0141 TaxID=2716417 RepID=A0AAW9Q5X1_9CYAN|nr:sugar transferase [Tumidithrix elongata RA019]